MRLLHDLPLADLTPGRLWPRLDPPTRALAARALFDGDRSTRDQANHAIASPSDFAMPVYANSRWTGASTTSRGSCGPTKRWPRRC